MYAVVEEGFSRIEFKYEKQIYEEIKRIQHIIDIDEKVQ